MKNNKLDRKIIDICSKSVMPFEQDGNNSSKRNVPDWLVLYNSAIKLYARNITDIKATPKSDAMQLFVYPFFKAAKVNLQSEPRQLYNSLIPAIQEIINNSLINRLKNVSRYCIYSLANIKVRTNYELEPNEDVLLFEFVLNIYKNPSKFFSEYPVLARILSCLSLYWCDANKKMLSRIVTDYHDYFLLINEAAASVSGLKILESIRDIHTDLSDPHEMGQTVAIIAFSDGSRIVYKPKSVSTEFIFGIFVNWLNEQPGMQLKLKCLPVVDKGSYGWAQYIEHKTCENEDEVIRFFTRMGMFSALLFTLRGMDYHHGNMIAYGEHPLFIDHEMLFYPVYVDPENKELAGKSVSEVQAGYYESVINTRMYPIIEKRVSGSIVDVSAIGQYLETEINVHLPITNRVDHNPKKYLPNMINGFNDVYRILMNNKELLLSSRSPLNDFKKSYMRFNVRATSSYLSINNLCVVPEALKSGVDFCNMIHSIRVQLPSIFARGLPDDLRLDELKILTRLDVPRFAINPADKCLMLHDGKHCREILMYSGSELVEQRIRDLSENDMRRQVEYIERSFI